MAATTAGITAVSPADPPSTRVVVAGHRLDGGAKVKTADVTTQQVAADTLPDDALTDPASVVGRTLVAPVSKKGILTKVHVLGKSPVTGSGKVIAPVRIADSAVVKLLHVGDRVDVLASDPESKKSATVVARHARVATIPASDDSGSGIGVAARGNSQKATLLLMEVSSAEATTLANAASSSQLSVLLG